MSIRIAIWGRIEIALGGREQRARHVDLRHAAILSNTDTHSTAAPPLKIQRKYSGGGAPEQSNWVCSAVTAQVADISDGSEGEDQFFGLLHERAEDVPALLFGGREHRSDDHEVVGAGLGAESAGDFLPQPS